MNYTVGKKKIVIPEKELNSLEKNLEITREQAIQVWLEDNDYLENTEVEKLTEKAKANRRYEKSDKERKPSTRERKVDEIKAFLLQILMKSLPNDVLITSQKNEAEFAFSYLEDTYTVKLIKHRRAQVEKT